jgi:hypothetical protein
VSENRPTASEPCTVLLSGRPRRGISENLPLEVALAALETIAGGVVTRAGRFARRTLAGCAGRFHGALSVSQSPFGVPCASATAVARPHNCDARRGSADGSFSPLCESGSPADEHRAARSLADYEIDAA